MLKPLKEWYNKTKDILDINKRFPNYINKNLFRMVFFIFLVYTATILISTNGKMQWENMKCDSDSTCKSYFWICNETDLKLTQETSEHPCTPRSIATPKMIEFCDKYNCPQYLQPGQLIGEQIPRQVKEYPYIVFAMMFIVIIINHIQYIKKRK